MSTRLSLTPRRSWGSRIIRSRRLYLFLLPSYAMIALFCLYPLASGVYHSFTNWSGAGHADFIGLDNYREIAGDRELAHSVGNMVKLLIFSAVVSIVFPLIVAELIFAVRSVRRQYLYRVLFVIPMVVPGIVTILIWGYIFEPNYGLLNRLLTTVGLESWRKGWLGDPRIALYAIMFMGFPWVGTFNLLIFYAGLQNVPQSVWEAARIDGASIWRRLLSVDIPLLAGQVKLLLILAVISGVQSFQSLLILTQGGPGWATYVPGLCMFDNAFRFGRMGYASAIGMVLCLVIIGLTYLNVRFLKTTQI